MTSLINPFQSSLTTQFHGRVFHGYGYGELSPANRPRENTSMRVITRMEVFSRGRFAGTIRGDVLLLYIYYTSTRACEIPAHGTVGTAHTGTGAGTSVPHPREIPAHGTGGLYISDT